MITASQQIDRVANSLTYLVKSRAVPAREIKSLVLRLDRIANTLDQGASSRRTANSAGLVVWNKLKKARAAPESNVFTGFEAVQRYGVTEQEWQAAKREGVVVQEEGGWKVQHPLHFMQKQGAKKKSMHR